VKRLLEAFLGVQNLQNPIAPATTARSRVWIALLRPDHARSLSKAPRRIRFRHDEYLWAGALSIKI
jgi:hypothetical protein